MKIARSPVSPPYFFSLLQSLDVNEGSLSCNGLSFSLFFFCLGVSLFLVVLQHFESWKNNVKVCEFDIPATWNYGVESVCTFSVALYRFVFPSVCLFGANLHPDVMFLCLPPLPSFSFFLSFFSFFFSTLF